MIYKYNKTTLNLEANKENKYCWKYTHFATAIQRIRHTVINNPVTLASCFKRFHNLNNVTQQTAIIMAYAVHNRNGFKDLNRVKNMQHFKNLGERYNRPKNLLNLHSTGLLLHPQLMVLYKQGITIREFSTCTEHREKKCYLCTPKHCWKMKEMLQYNNIRAI